MQLRMSRTLVILLAGSVVALAPVLAQTSTVSTLPGSVTSNWDDAQTSLSSSGKLIVVTADEPHQRRVCHVRSMTAERLVCRAGIGLTRTYLPEQIAALIVPGDKVLTIAMFTGFNAGLGASIWSTIILAAACPLCAAGTAAAAFLFFDLGGATLFTGPDPERLAYLAPGQDEAEVNRLRHS
jgi:hypothetical protein